MRYSKELTVGASLALAAVIFILGVRFFEDIPLLRGSYELRTEFRTAQGLIPGNEVRVRGIKVGTVEDVALDRESGNVAVQFRIDKGLEVTRGTYTKVTGIDALGVTRLELELGPRDAEVYEAGALVPSCQLSGACPGSDLMGTLSDSAPVLLSRLDTVLVSADGALSDARVLLGDANSNFNQTLAALRGTAASLNAVIAGEQEQLRRAIRNMESASRNIDGTVTTLGDSAAVTLSNLNATLARLDRNLAALEAASANLDSLTAGLDVLVARLNAGEGTAGRLLNDDGLYLQLDSAATNLNALLGDFRANPARYIRHMRLVDLF